jgi:hypothetical protein
LTQPSDEPYQIRESDRFTRQAEFELVDIRRWDEIKETLDLFIARNPLSFERVPGTSLYAVGLSTIPPLTLYFSVNSADHVVTYEGIERT